MLEKSLKSVFVWIDCHNTYGQCCFLAAKKGAEDKEAVLRMCGLTVCARINMYM